MRYGSVCSGVEAASLAWHHLGWECKFVAEVEPFPCAVLQERFGASAPIHPLDPDDVTITAEEWAYIEELKKEGRDWTKICENADLVSRFKDKKMRESWKKDNALLKTEGVIPNEGDFTKIGKKYAGKIDLLVGGTPCQDLSIAGKRAGFDGERSSLAIDFVRLAYESECKWIVWENVPGVFSSNKGRDFARFLSLLVGREIAVPKNGWGTTGFVCNDRRDRFGVAWRVLDAQFTRTSRFPFAVPQRRRRVFVVGYFGDWTRAAEVLLEPERLLWDTPVRFRTGERFTSNAETNSGETSTFWNMNDYAESLTCTSDRQLMPDKARLQCIIERRNSTDITATETFHLTSMNDGSSHTLKARDYKDPQIVCLNDQGGSVMSVESDGNAGTLRANTHGNEQIVCGAFLGTQGSKAMGIGYSEEVSPTQRAGAEIDLVQTLKIRSGKEGGGKEALIQNDLSATLGCGNDQTLFVAKCYENHANDSRITESNEVSPLISSRAGTGGGNLPLVQETIAFEPGIAKREGGHSRFAEGICSTLRCDMGDNQTAVAIAENIIGRKIENGGNGIGAQEEIAYTQNASGVMGVCTSIVRRLLPIECERLMGFPDNHTRIAWKGKSEEDCPDAPRYKACGNSMCVNVMQWIGEQIQKVKENI